MRVLHVAPTVAASDGTSVAVLAMLRALWDESGIDAQLLSGRYDGLPLHPALPSGPSVQVLQIRQPFGGHLGYTVGYPPGFTQALRQRATDVELVHIHGLWLYPTFLGGPILRRLPRSYVLSLHGGLMTDAMARSGIKKQIALTLFERVNIEAARMVIATSQTELDELRMLGFSVPGKVLPLAVDPALVDFLSRARETEAVERGGDQQTRTILCVSRFHSRKRLVEAVRAFADVAPLFPQWRLRIAGPDYEPGYRSKVLAAGRESGISDRLSAEPAIEGERLWTAYREADLFLLASAFENFGLVIAEALAAGIPVITTRGAPWPQLASQRCGWWIDPSLETLSSTLKEAMSMSPEVRREMGQRGVRLIEEDFSLRALARGLTAAYESALDPLSTAIVG